MQVLDRIEIYIFRWTVLRSSIWASYKEWIQILLRKSEKKMLYTHLRDVIVGYLTSFVFHRHLT